MRKICVFNIKGGVGKTTTSVNLAAGLSRKGKKVLLMDMDAQASVSSCLEANEENKNMRHFMVNGAGLQECITHMGTDLDLVASSESLNDIDAELGNRADKYKILKTKMEKQNSYDYVILDCPPHFGTMTKNALFYADELLIPISTDVLGYAGLKKTMSLVKKQCNGLKIKIVPTFYDKRLKISRDVLNLIQNEYYEKVTDSIRANSKLKEAPKKKRSIFAYAKSSSGAEDYERLAVNIMHGEAENESQMSHIKKSQEAAVE